MDELPSKSSSGLIAHWRRKVGCALRGLVIGMRGESSFAVHVPAAIVVCALGAWLKLSAIEWSLVFGCIAIVCSAELLNSAIEQLAKAITDEHNPRIRDALDLASSAVLMASLGAAVVGCIVLVWPLLRRFYVG